MKIVLSEQLCTIVVINNKNITIIFFFRYNVELNKL